MPASQSQYEETLKQVRSLSAADQRRLLSELEAEHQSVAPDSRSILELEGLGQEIWAGIDPDEYIRQERESWNR
jgi:hypothetical protein